MAVDDLVGGGHSVESDLSAAEAAAAGGRLREAEVGYRRLLGQPHVTDYEYGEWARRLAEIYASLGRYREAGQVHLYLEGWSSARALFARDGSAAGLARVALQEQQPRVAAQAFQDAGRPVQAAVAFEQAGDAAAARELWAGLVRDPRLAGRPYEQALVHFNLGLATARAVGGTEGAAAARAPLALAVRLIEEVADEFETCGQRDRAFDCYQILLKLGLDSGAFENLSEGYLNCIRLLKEDGLKFYALQYIEDFVKLALEHGELQAAALLYREAAEYALREGLPYDRSYQRQAGATWWRVAERDRASGAPVELVENAELAAVERWAVVGDFEKVRAGYARLAGLELSDRKRARYAAIAERFRAAPTSVEADPGFPEHLRPAHAYASVWYEDLVEWEMDGDPDQVAAAVVGDTRYPSGLRRRALTLLLLLADARLAQAAEAPEVLVQVAELLGALRSYPALRPLERLYAHRDPKVRRAAVRALRLMPFKRSFVTVLAGLDASDPGVREAALEAVRSLHFVHAFQPLTRIVREHADDQVKVAALESIGQIGSVEAGELLIGVVRHETGKLLEAARRALTSFQNPDFLPILRAHLEQEANPEVRKVLQGLTKGG